jgi:NAD(P)-dependent dehydrogenase (short-subunit alcohol dehydrogenase family)
MKSIKDSLSGKVALVTGAGSGIGKATAKLLGYAGARVALLGRDLGPLEETGHALRHPGFGEALVLQADVADPAAMREAIAMVKRTWWRLDIVVANAGVNGVWAPLEEITADEWDQTLGINLRGTFLTVQGALPLLKTQGGAIVVVSSINGSRIFRQPGATAYACSKAAQITLVKMLAVELGPHRVRINAVCPGAIETNIDVSTNLRNLESIREPSPPEHIPLTHDEPGTAGEVAELIWFLTSDFSDHITGAEVVIDGGQSLG